MESVIADRAQDVPSVEGHAHQHDARRLPEKLGWQCHRVHHQCIGDPLNEQIEHAAVVQASGATTASLGAIGKQADARAKEQ